MGLFTLHNCCVTCSLDYLESQFESKSRLSFPEFSDYHCEQISDIIKYNTPWSKNINKQILNSSRRIAFLLGITMLNQKIIYKDDIKIVTEFPRL